MRISSLLLCLVSSVVCTAAVALAADSARPVEPVRITPEDWPWWRGPQRNGVANPDQDPPLTWSATENVLWRTPIPGRGHGSATVVGDFVFIAAADGDTEQQMVLCVDRENGEELWRTTVHEGGFPEGGNEKASLASSTPACDGRRVFINFLNGGAVHTTALDLEGELLWQRKISDYVLHQGYGSSPAIYQHLVIAAADNKGGGRIVAMDRHTGETVWQRARPKTPNYPSPIVLHVSGRDQLLMTGCDLVTSLDPLTGEELWEIAGATTECVTSTVTDGERIFTTGGYPRNHIAAIAADGSGEVAWENRTRAYVPSMLAHQGHLYAVLDAGIATCLRSSTGEELWKARLGGTFSSSPVLVGDRIYATNEGGETYVFKATPEGYQKLAESKLGDSVFATPAICGSRIYLRVAHHEEGKRQEYLYCLGKRSR